MARMLLSDDEWKVIEEVFPEPTPTGRPRKDPRMIVNAIFRVLRAGAPWQDLPDECGPWQTLWRVFDRWHADRSLDTMLRRLQAAFVGIEEIDDELWCIDGTVVRTHRCVAWGGNIGGRKRQRIMH